MKMKAKPQSFITAKTVVLRENYLWDKEMERGKKRNKQRGLKARCGKVSCFFSCWSGIGIEQVKAENPTFWATTKLV